MHEIFFYLNSRGVMNSIYNFFQGVGQAVNEIYNLQYSYNHIIFIRKINASRECHIRLTYIKNNIL